MLKTKKSKRQLELEKNLKDDEILDVIRTFNRDKSVSEKFIIRKKKKDDA